MRFSGVSALGVGVQLAVVAVLATAWHLDYRAATLAGVAAAIVHNFLSHRRWTWGERRGAGDDARRRGGPSGPPASAEPEGSALRTEAAATFARFVAANGVVSIGGNVAVMIVLVGGAHVPVVPANLAAIALCGVANFWLADRLVFEGCDRTPR
jgi:putative flippase GtrA